MKIAIGFSVVSGREGMYYGEWKKTKPNSKPHGRGLLVCEDKVILGYLEEGSWAPDSPQIIVYKKENLFQVFSLKRVRPNSILQEEYGFLYGQEGLAASGYFRDGILVHSQPVENQASGFMGMSGKYSVLREQGFKQMNKYFGEHDHRNEPRGKGISVHSNGQIVI